MQTQKIPQASTDTQITDAFEKRMERLSLFDSSSRFLAANAPQPVSAPAHAPMLSPVEAMDTDATWRARIASAPVVMQGAPGTARPKFAGARSPLETVLEDPGAAPEAQADVFVQG
jgi:hypothetical protein